MRMFAPHAIRRVLTAALLVSCCVVLGAVASSAAAAGPTTITFQEPEKGSVFHYIDNAPKTKPDKHGNPSQISAGDGLTLWNPMVSGGKQIGHLQAFCWATKTAKKFPNAEWECVGTFVLGTGTLSATARIGPKGTEGAITGGTGSYAGARGVFVSNESVSPAVTTITLIE
jgi:hypothetical protein